MAAGIEANRGHVDRIGAQIDRLRNEWLAQVAHEGQLRNNLQQLGVDPHAVPRALVQEVSAADRTPTASWRNDTISKSQIAKLEELARQVDKAFTVDLTITKGEAHDLISSILSGNYKEVQVRDRPSGPLLTAPVRSQPETVSPAGAPEPRAAITGRILRILAEPDAEADIHAQTSVNTPAQFLAWAEGHFTIKAQVALADLMTDRQNLSDDMFLACRAVLLDRSHWQELGHTAAEAYWQARTDTPIQHPTTTAIVEAVVPAREGDDRALDEDYLETAHHAAADTIGTAAAELTLQERIEQLDAVQEALDLGVAPEMEDWNARAYAAFDSATPLDLPAIDSDPGFAAALRKLKGEKARTVLRQQWWDGAARAQRDATAPDMASLFEQAAASPRLIETIGGRTADVAESTSDYTAAFHDTITDLAADGSATRQAAAQLIGHDPRRWTPEGFTETVVAAWNDAHRDDLTWTPQVQAAWTLWMRKHLRDEPLVGTWAGLPPHTRQVWLESGIATAFDVLAKDRPDLVEATASIAQSRLAAELRSNVVPTLHTDRDATTAGRHEIFEARGPLGIRLKSKPRAAMRHGSRGWSYTLDGGVTYVNGGGDHRFATARLLEAGGHPIPDWIDRAYQPLNEAHHRVLSTAALLARGHEFYHATAHSEPIWEQSPTGFNAVATPILREARSQIIADLHTTLPTEMSLLESAGFDLDLVLMQEVDRPLLLDLRHSGPTADQYQNFDATDVTIYAAGHVIVGDPDGAHIQISTSNLGTRGPLSLDGQVYAGIATWREALTHARSLLPIKRASHTNAEPTAPQHTDVDAKRNAGEEAAEPDPEPDAGLDTHTAAGSANLSPNSPSPTAERVDMPIVPEHLHGEPISSPLWRHGGLIEARKDSGATIWISPATAAEYGYQPPATDTAAQESGTRAPGPAGEPVAQVVAATDFHLGTDVLVPSGAKARVHANIAAAQLVTELSRTGRAATEAEQAVLAQWSGWGAAPEVFDNRARFREHWSAERADLLQVLGERGFAQARATTLNAHYTDPAIVAELWRAVTRAGLPDDALMLEPGCGAGHFVGTAPERVHMVGVEIEPISAQIAHHLYPSQQIRNHGFERSFAADMTFSGAIGNVPFGKYGVYDPIHNAAGHSLHNQFIVKSLALTAPGGYVAVVTSAYTSDAKRADARKKITETGDLVGAVRLPTGAFDRQAKTAVVTDVLVFRRREQGQEPTAETLQWAGDVTSITLDHRGPKDSEEPHKAEQYWINDYFRRNPERVLGNLAIGHGANGNLNLIVEPRTRSPLAEQLRRQLDPIIDQAVNQGLGFSAPAPAPGVADPFTVAGLLTDTDLDSTTVEPGTMRYDEVNGQFEQFKIGQGWIYANCTGKDKAEQWKVLIALGETVMNLTEASRSTQSTRAERDGLRVALNNLYDSYTDRWGPLNRFTLTDPAPLTENRIAERLAKTAERWRVKAGKAEARDEGANPDDAKPYDGPIPDEILEELQDNAATQPLPQKNQSHLKGAILRDPRVGMVLAIENFRSRFDGTEAEVTKSPIFTEDTTPFKTRAETADNFDEAMAISFDELGHISPERMGELLDIEIGDVVEWSRGRMFHSVEQPGEWEMAEKFLSGNVRDKLTKARMLAAEDPELYGAGVEALEAVIPADVDPATIGVRPGATWVPMQYYRQFLIAEFGLNDRQLTTEFDRVSGNWHFETTQLSRHENTTSGYADKYGSNRLPGVALFNLIANNRAVQVNKTEEELERSPKPRFHQELTAAARSSATALQERFREWLWSDGDRYVALAATYNELCNSFVKPQFDAEYKQFPGLNPKYTLYDYQAAAVQRFLHDETILLDHVVGAGKTLTMTSACMEAKRLGQVRQPWVVVPNHLLSQWGNEARDAYPTAKILVASELSGVEDRQRFIGQTAVGDWDMVIVPQSVFGLIGMKREAQLEYLDNEIIEMRAALDAANVSGSEFSVKQIENAIKATTKRVETIIEQKSTDDGLSFEQSGCDFLWIDEAHDYKNLSRPSNSADLSVPEGSQRASDLEMKARFLRKQAQDRNAAAGKPNAPAKALAFATGTPITNAMSEIWVMTKMLRPDLLTKAGMGRIDNWAGTFAKPVTAVEMNITGTKLRMVTRMAEYANVRQLVAMLDQFRDVVTADKIPVQLPKMAGGAPTIAEYDMGQDVIDFVADLDDRLGNLQGDRMDIDNSLKVSTDGRNVTMHPRLANLPSPPPENSRVEVAANLIWDCHTDNTDVFIPADKHGPDMTGVFQLVFCDRGTPKAGDGRRARNVYTELKYALVDRGMNPEEIAFMHDHDSPKAKAKLIESCRDGRVRVLLTSTKKGGTGLNAQRALKQLINLDPAWTAADMEQRIGRIIRQGNAHDTVSVVNVVARRSYDAMMYQYVARKSAFVAQLRRADVPQTMEDVGGDMSLSWAQTKAAATGDPVFVQQVEAEQKVQLLEAQRNAVVNNNAARIATIRSLERRIHAATERLPELQAQSTKLAGWLAIEDRTTRVWDFPGGGSVPDSESADVRAAIQESLGYARSEVTKDRKILPIASLAGVPVMLGYTHTLANYTVEIAGEERYVPRDKMIDIIGMDSAAGGFIQTIRNHVASVTRRGDALEAQIDRDHVALATAEAEPEMVFAHEDKLEQAKLTAHELRLEVNARENSPQALRKDRLDIDRRRAEGQYRGWSLDLNPTRGWAEEQGMTREAVIASVPTRVAQARQEWADNAQARSELRAKHPWKALDDTEAEWRFGFDQNSGMPGARTYWHGRQWNWQAWDGAGQRENGTANRRSDALATSERHTRIFTGERKIPEEKLYEASMQRGAQLRAHRTPPDSIVEPTEPILTPPMEKHGAEAATGEKSMVDAIKVAGSGHPRRLHDVIGNGADIDTELGTPPDPGQSSPPSPQPNL